MCSLAFTWMTIIDSQFYINDSLSLDVSLEWNANLVVALLYYETHHYPDNGSKKWNTHDSINCIKEPLYKLSIPNVVMWDLNKCNLHGAKTKQIRWFILSQQIAFFSENSKSILNLTAIKLTQSCLIKGYFYVRQLARSIADQFLLISIRFIKVRFLPFPLLTKLL